MPLAQHEKVLNLCQDVCAAVANIPIPKQVGTALYILKETCSKGIITLLNRLGNSISYWDAQRYVNTIASATDDQVSGDGIFIPSDLNATTHVMFQYGNTNIERSASVPLKKFIKPQERICLLTLGKLACPVKQDFKAGLLHGYL